MSNRSYSKCQKGLGKTTEYIFIFQKNSAQFIGLRRIMQLTEQDCSHQPALMYIEN